MGVPLRQPVLYVTGDDIPDVLVGILSQTGFKVMQKCNFLPTFIFLSICKYYWWEHSLMHYVNLHRELLGVKCRLALKCNNKAGPNEMPGHQLIHV